MAQTLTLARPARNLRPYLWLALPLLVLATLFFFIILFYLLIIHYYISVY